MLSRCLGSARVLADVLRCVPRSGAAKFPVSARCKTGESGPETSDQVSIRASQTPSGASSGTAPGAASGQDIVRSSQAPSGQVNVCAIRRPTQ